MELKLISPSSIEVGSRFREDVGDISDLVLSFKKEGVIQPLAVMAKDGGDYLLLAGGRRLAAAKKAELPTVPVRIYPSTLTELERRSIELYENIIRKDMPFQDELKLKAEIHRLQQEIHGERISTTPGSSGWGLKETANLLGTSIGSLAGDLKLAKAMEQFPILAQSKNKAEAAKKLTALEEGIVKAELAKRISEKQATTPAERLHQGIIDHFVVGDIFDVMSRLPDGSMDLIEFDPPYGIDLTRMKQNFASNWESYNDVPAEAYCKWIQLALSECFRLLKSSGWLLLWFAKEPWIDMIYHSLCEAGFKTSRLTGIWIKTGQNQTNQPELYLANAYEEFFYARKGDARIQKPGRSNTFDFRQVAPQNKIHPAERPIELIMELLSTFAIPGASVLAPCCGSGNTILACANLGLGCIGIDDEQSHKDSFSLRVVASKPPLYRSYKLEV